MKRILLLVTLIATLSYGNVDLGLEDFSEFETISYKQDSGFKNYWDEHFIGRTGLYYINSIDWNRFSKYVTLAYEESWSRLKVNTELRFIHSTLNAKFVYYEGFEDTEISAAVDTTDFEFRQLYIEYDINDYLNVSLGKQTIVWGQGSYMSPVDFLLPPDFFSLKTNMTKKERRVPLEVAQLNIYPIENVEVQLYYLPKYKTMDLGSLDQDIQEGMAEDPTKSISDFIDTPVGKKDEAQYAIRSMYYSKWGTFGITYFEGWFWLPLPAPTVDIDSGDFNDEFLKVFKQRTIGLEYSKVVGNSTYSLEYVRLNLPQTITPLSGNILDNTDYILWILGNNYKAYADMHLDIVSTGWDYNGDRWTTNLYLNYLFPSLSENAKEGLESIDESYEMTVIPLPVINIARYIGSGENKLAGFAFGYYGATVGGSLYYVHEFDEVFTLRVGLEALVDFAELRPDALEYKILDENGEEQSYWRKNGINAGPSVALTYKL